MIDFFMSEKIVEVYYAMLSLKMFLSFFLGKFSVCLFGRWLSEKNENHER